MLWVTTDCERVESVAGPGAQSDAAATRAARKGRFACHCNDGPFLSEIVRSSSLSGVFGVIKSFGRKWGFDSRFGFGSVRLHALEFGLLLTVSCFVYMYNYYADEKCFGGDFLRPRSSCVARKERHLQGFF